MSWWQVVLTVLAVQASEVLISVLWRLIKLGRDHMPEATVKK